MRLDSANARGFLAAGASVAALSVSALPAEAGGFDVREQSALYQGMSFAGAAAGGTALGSMFWNPAAAGFVGEGFTFDSSYSLIIPRADLTVTSIDPDGPGPLAAADPDSPFAGPFQGLDTTVDVGRDAVVPASYMAYRYSKDLVFALSMNSQYGLGTKPDNTDWIGSVVGRSSKLFSINAAPTVAYEIAPGIQVGAGVQIQYMDLMHFKSSTDPAAGSPSSILEGTDWGFGYTVGVNLAPTPGTSIGIGFRSSIGHELDGSVRIAGTPGPAGVQANLDLPEKVTASLRQDLMPGIRAHATVEWTNWSRFTKVPVVLDDDFIVLPTGQPVASLDFEWEDGWYFALGGEYDYSQDLTLRAGIGYEISPVRDATSRLVQLPDNDRVWLSAGVSYKVGDLFGLLNDATIDLAYTHIFVEDGDFERFPSSVLAGGAPLIAGEVDASVDIVSVGLRSTW